MSAPAILVLEDGTEFCGRSIGASGYTAGEVVFNTAMTGYQEILTDPSYARQIVTLTYPHIGNTGSTPEDCESRSVFAAGLVIRNLPTRVSNWRSTESLADFLRDRGVIGISDIDTRQLTRLLRDRGTQRGCIAAGAECDKQHALSEARAFPGLAGMDLAREVSVTEPYDWDGGGWSLTDGYRAAAPVRWRIAAYDFGIKHNILRLLVDRGCAITVVPAQTPADEVLAMGVDGVFLSNGPGDPEPCQYAVDAIARLLHSGVPLFGICLGHQLLALASGARTLKMKFGHHGANHPVQDLDSKRVFITSQNHGFTVDEATIPAHLRITHRSLFDGSVQGLAHRELPAFSFQGHPEASPGPHDIGELFDRFLASMEQHQANAAAASNS